MIQEYIGQTGYLADHEVSIELNDLVAAHRLFIGVPCQVGSIEAPIIGLLDMASEWCVMPPGVARALGYDLSSPALFPITMKTRFGDLRGSLEKVPLRFIAEAGEPVTVDATFFVAEGWPGRMVIGWKGCLERIRFGLDPGSDTFYFADY